MTISTKEIARLAGVSHMTVSRVLNNSDKVKPSTYEKVMKVIKQYDYTPSMAARALASGKTNNIGLLVMYDLKQFPADFLPSILEGISSQLVSKGYYTSLYYDQIEGKKDLAPINQFNEKYMDGLMVISVESKEKLKERIANIKIPTVLINQKVELEGVSYVCANDMMGAYKAVSYLISLNHTNIAMICGPEKYTTSVNRLEGYYKSLNDANISIQEDLILQGNFNKNDAYNEVKTLLGKRKDVTAIFAANDVMALGAYKAIKEQGLLIPDDISVVGYDNQEYCDLIDPELTTVSKHRREMGKKAVEVMLSRLEGNEDTENVFFDPELIVRKSTIKTK